MGRINSSLLINESPMQFLPSLGIVLDNNNKAIFLQQLQYLLNISNVVINNKKYVYNTFAEWNMMFPMFSVRTIKRMVEEFKTLNLDGEIYHIIKTKKVNCGGINYKMYYTIDYDEMARLEEKAKIKKIYKRREIVLDTPHMLFNYQRYVNQYPNELPENIIDLLKWAVKNEVKISESWQKSDEGKELMQELEKAKCQRSTHEVPACHSVGVTIAENSQQAFNNNESDNLTPQECYADTAECLQDTNGVQPQHFESATVTLPTILSKTYTKKYNIDLEQEKKNYHDKDDDKGAPTTNDVEQVIKLFSDNNAHQRALLPLERKKVIEFCNEFSTEWTAAAIEQSVMYDHPTLKYIENILLGWQKYGFMNKPPKKETVKIKKEIKGNSENQRLSSLPAEKIYEAVTDYYSKL